MRRNGLIVPVWPLRGRLDDRRSSSLGGSPRTRLEAAEC